MSPVEAAIVRRKLGHLVDALEGLRPRYVEAVEAHLTKAGL